MRTFLLRLSTAIGFALVVIAGLAINHWSLLFLMLVILIGSVLEFYRICRPLYGSDDSKLKLYRAMVVPISIISILISYSICFGYLDVKVLFSLPIFLAPIFYTELFLRSKKPFRNIGINLLAIYYIAMPIALTFFVANIGGSFSGIVILGILFIVWGNDSGAYILGSLLGKNKLIPHISPNKTIEGFIGGGLFCFLVAYLNIHVFKNVSGFENLSMLKPYVWYFIAGAVFVFATIGDLVESLLKRNLEIKDSGNILPGHGGFLDRFDAFLFVMPFVVAIIKIFN